MRINVLQNVHTSRRSARDMPDPSPLSQQSAAAIAISAHEPGCHSDGSGSFSSGASDTHTQPASQPDHSSPAQLNSAPPTSTQTQTRRRTAFQDVRRQPTLHIGGVPDAVPAVHTLQSCTANSTSGSDAAELAPAPPHARTQIQPSRRPRSERCRTTNQPTVSCQSTSNQPWIGLHLIHPVPRLQIASLKFPWPRHLQCHSTARTTPVSHGTPP